MMIGMFAVSEILRNATAIDTPWEMAKVHVGNVFAGMGRLIVKYPMAILRGSTLGTLIGALPGAGADIAAWMSYAMSKKFSKEPEKFGTGHVEGIVEAGAANNSALAGAWIPALVFGIPGDSITAIVIGVLYIKGLNPGPTAVHAERAQHLRDLPGLHPRQPAHASARRSRRSSAQSRCCGCRAKS
jgi:TctA family transporter